MHRLIRNYTLYFLLILGCAAFLFAQTPDSLSTPVKMKIPRNAMIYSALCPGLGQWYNEQKIKSVIVFGGEAALIGNAVYYNQQLVKSHVERDINFYDNLRGQFIWYSAFFYLINILDAYVDAHLFTFDVGPDLSNKNEIMQNLTCSMQINLPLSSVWRRK